MAHGGGCGVVVHGRLWHLHHALDRPELAFSVIGTICVGIGSKVNVAFASYVLPMCYTVAASHAKSSSWAPE